MAKPQTIMTLLTLFLLSFITTTTATAASRSITLGRRGLATYCDPLFGGCTEYQWPFSPITSNHHFIPRTFVRRPSPSLPPIVVPSPPPVFTNPSFTPPSDYANPSFSPLVASPPPSGLAINTPVFPELPPAGGYINTSPPFLGLSFSPPVGDNLPPIAGKNQPGVLMSPPVANANLPPIVGELPQQQPQEVMVPPPVGGGARKTPQLPPVVQSPPAP